MTILELRAKLGQQIEDAAKYLDEHPMMTADEQKVYDDMKSELDSIKDQIQRQEDLERMTQSMSQPTSKAIVNEPTKAKDFRATDEYKTAMEQAMRSKFRNVSNALMAGTDTAGGYLIPTEYESTIVEKLKGENIMRTLGTVITTNGEHKINVAATMPAAAWIGEGESLTFGEGTFSQITLDAHKLHVAVKVTNELLADSAFDLDSFITREFAAALANAEEDAMLNGDGSAKCTGIFDDTKGGEAYKSVAAVTGDELIGLVYSLKRAYRKNASFIMNDATIASVRTLKDSNGQYIWQPSVQAGEPDTLLGYPVYTSQFSPANKIGFGDASYYKIGDRGTRTMDMLTELFAGNDMTAFVAKERVDAKLTLPEAFKVLTITG